MGGRLVRLEILRAEPCGRSFRTAGRGYPRSKRGRSAGESHPGRSLDWISRCRPRVLPLLVYPRIACGEYRVPVRAGKKLTTKGVKSTKIAVWRKRLSAVSSMTTIRYRRNPGH